MEKRPLPPGFQSGKTIQPIELPMPSAFRQLRPAILGTPPITRTARLFERKRVIVGLCIAAGLHIVLGFAWWLSPPLRLKAGYGPDRWVQILSLGKTETPASSPPPPVKKADTHPSEIPPLLEIPPQPAHSSN